VSIQVIVLNGGSSSGKSGIARCLQAVLPDPWLTLGTDTLVEAAPSSGPTSAAGIEFRPDGEVIVGPEFRALEAAWMTGIAAMAHAGAHIILDEVFLSGSVSQRRWQNAFGPLPVLWVGVRCDREVAAAREIARGDRIPGMAASQADLVHEGMVYDLEVDTGQAEALECARIIAAYIEREPARGIAEGSTRTVEREPAREAKGESAAQAEREAAGDAEREPAHGAIHQEPVGGVGREATTGGAGREAARDAERGPTGGVKGECARGAHQVPISGVGPEPTGAVERGSTRGANGAAADAVARASVGGAEQAAARGAERGPARSTEPASPKAPGDGYAQASIPDNQRPRR
jgi:chloramphenicol 3-O phosphotransferase